MPCSTAQRPTASTSAGEATAPVGLDGEHHSSTFVRSVRAASSCSTRHPVALVLGGHDVDRDAAGQPDRLGVRRPVRRGEQHLVARVQQRRERLVDGLLAAVRDEHLRRRHGQAAVAQRLVDDRLLELGQPARGRVAVVGRHRAGRLGGSDDRGRRREVGLAGAEADDVLAGGLLGLGLGVDGERRGLGDRAHPRGDARTAGGGRRGGRLRGGRLGGCGARHATMLPCRAAGRPTAPDRSRSRAGWSGRRQAVHSTVWGPTPLLRRAHRAGWLSRRTGPRRGVAQLARAPVSKTGCRRFDSCHPCWSDHEHDGQQEPRARPPGRRTSVRSGQVHGPDDAGRGRR